MNFLVWGTRALGACHLIPPASFPQDGHLYGIEVSFISIPQWGHFNGGLTPGMSSEGLPPGIFPRFCAAAKSSIVTFFDIVSPPFITVAVFFFQGYQGGPAAS